MFNVEFKIKDFDYSVVVIHELLVHITAGKFVSTHVEIITRNH